MASVGKLSCHIMYIICCKAPEILFRIFLAFLEYTVRKIIYGQILCSMVKCRVNILQVVCKAYGLQEIVIHNRLVGLIFVIWCGIVRETCE